MLPIMGQKLALGNVGRGALFQVALIIVAQLVMIPMPILVGRRADRWGRKTIFLAAFITLAAIAFGALLLFFFAMPETCPVTLVPTAAPPVVDPTRARPSGHGIAVMMPPGPQVVTLDGTAAADHGLVLYHRARSVRGRQRLIDVPNTSAALGRVK
jgi:MFS family permease